MALTSFGTPGGVDELDAAGRANWSLFVSDLLERNRTGHPQFFNPLSTDSGPAAATKIMRWAALSRKLSVRPVPLRWTLGENRDAQEEYCEWVAIRDAAGRIDKVIFTTEVPDYYRFLAKRSPDVLVALYKKHVSSRVKREDLFNGLSYNPRNRWNAAGAMHMVQQSNTLEAAVVLVAQATDQKKRGNAFLTNAADLIPCGIGADGARNSDPLIVTEVNTLARQKLNISLTDPMGLYLDRLRTAGWQTPDGTDPATFWKVVRGSAAHGVRAVLQVPKAKGYKVSDITINGTTVTSPTQIASFVDVRITGLAFGTNPAPPTTCSGGGQLAAPGNVTFAEISNVASRRG
jgi:hypothetical protein